MAITVLRLPVEQSPISSLIGGIQAGESLRQGMLKNQMSQDQVNYLPQALQTAQDTAVAKLRSQQISNQYLPQLDAARLQGLNINNSDAARLTAARLGLLGAQQQMMNTKQSEMNPLFQARLQGLNLTNQGTGLKNQLLQRAMQGNAMPGMSIGDNGLTMNMPSGMGGINASLPAASMSSAAPGMGGNILRSPAAPTSRYSTQGSTLIDNNTGKAISVPTIAQASLMQKQLQSDATAQQQLAGAFPQIAQELRGGAGPISRGVGAVEKFFNKDSAPYDQYIAQVTTGLPQTTEKLLKGFQLNATGENFQRTLESVQPQKFDTPSSYAWRVATSLTNLALTTNQAQQYLKSGIPLQADKNGAPTYQALQNYFYNRMISNLNPIKIPSSAQASKSAFQSWAKKLPAAQRTQLMYQLKFNNGTQPAGVDI